MVPEHFHLVTDSVAGATGTLHGGCGLAATGIALERVTGRPISFIAGQYLLERLLDQRCKCMLRNWR